MACRRASTARTRPPPGPERPPRRGPSPRCSLLPVPSGDLDLAGRAIARDAPVRLFGVSRLRPTSPVNSCCANAQHSCAFWPGPARANGYYRAHPSWSSGAGIPKSPVGEITVTVDLHGAMRSFAAGVCVMTTCLDEATSCRHDGLMVTATRQHAPPARRRGAARSRLNRRGTSNSNGHSVATGQPSLFTNRCYKEYL
jgi:hypothetical protein